MTTIRTLKTAFLAFTLSAVLLSCKKDRVQEPTPIEEEVNIENTVLVTQSDVDNFGKLNVKEIKGSLIIGNDGPSSDSIRNLSGLTALKEIRYNLVINNNFAGKDLTGLSNLQKVGGFKIGSFDLSSNAASNSSTMPAFEEVNLPALTTVNSDFTVNYQKLVKVSMPKLSKVYGQLFLRADNLNSIELPALENVSGGLYVRGASTNGNTALKNLELPALKQVNGEFNLFYLKTLATMTTSVNKVGTLTVNNSQITSISFPDLNVVENTISLTENMVATTVAFPKLVSVGSISILFNPLINSVSMGALTNVSKDFSLKNAVVTNVDNLGALTTVGGTLALENLNLLTSLTGLKSLKSVNLLSLKVLPGLVQKELDLSAFTKVGVDVGSGVLTKIKAENISGSLYLTGTATVALPDISGVKTIGGTLRISSGTITTFALPELTTIGGNFEIALTAFTSASLPKLTKINGQLNVMGATSNNNVTTLTTLDAFNGLTSVGSVKLTKLTVLTSTMGIKNAVKNLADKDWSMTGCKTDITLTQAKAGWTGI